MAKKTKNQKLTEADKEHLEKCFQRVRDQSLRQWYEQTNDDDPQIKAAAQARLQLQLWLRDKRSEIAVRKVKRDECKADGDAEGMDVARKKLKQSQIAMAMQMRMSVEGIPASTAAKACKQWNGTSHSLEEMLDDFDLDKRTEFGVSRDNLPTMVAETGNEELHKHDLGFTNALDINLPEHQDDSIGHKDTKEADTRRPPIPDPTDIWTQHALHMQERYRHADVPHFAVVTKLAIQKKLFDRHVDRELQVREAAQITPTPDASFQPTRSGITTTWNPVLATAAFAEHSLWELTSSLLWRYFEGGLSWEYPHWVPSGIMRIETVSNRTHVSFDFGMRTFSTHCISIPATVGTRTLSFSAECHQNGAIVDIDIIFLAHGFVRVFFPVHAVVEPDLGCEDVPVTPIELTGLWMGPVE